jgi:hypothetical protein
MVKVTPKGKLDCRQATKSGGLTIEMACYSRHWEIQVLIGEDPVVALARTLARS